MVTSLLQALSIENQASKDLSNPFNVHSPKMKISNIRKEQAGQYVRISADAQWEQTSRIETVFFEVKEQFQDALSTAPDSFLIAYLMPAMFSGEKRITVEGTIEPLLYDGLVLNTRTFAHWYYKPIDPIRIDVDTASVPPAESLQQASKREAVFLSGGLDALFSLRKNRLNYPLGQPGSVQDGILVHGFDMPLSSKRGQMLFDRAVRAATPVAKDADIDLLTIRSNIREIDSETGFWVHQFHGAALASVAHALSGRIRRVIIGTSGAYDALEPWGSHPCTDSNYSSTQVQIVHDMLWPRFDKVKTIADWPVGLKHVRICNSHDESNMNCCRCNKCLRTMVMLLALGKLESSSSFPHTEIEPKRFRECCRLHPQSEIKADYLPIIEGLIKHGRSELAKVIRGELGFKGKLLRIKPKELSGALDKKYLGGTGTAIFRRLKRIAGK
jgi:hypothetical protein